MDPRYAVHDLEYQIEGPPRSSDSERINAPPPRPSRSRVLLASAFTVSILLAALGLLLGIPGVVAIFATLAIAFGAIRIDRKARRILRPRTRLADSTPGPKPASSTQQSNIGKVWSPVSSGRATCGDAYFR